MKAVVKHYDTLAYAGQLIQLLSAVYPAKDFTSMAKFELHQILSEVILNNYPGEFGLKYELFKHYIKKNVVAAFEIRVHSSRVDFLAINGSSTSFEIKSELDNLTKLKKQTADYLLAFEYNYAIIDERHLQSALKLIPTNFGLWTFHNGKKKIYREATLNRNTSAEVQLSLLTKKELNKNFNEVEGDTKSILSTFDEATINARFKRTLKERYQNRWNFIVDNSHEILPIDLQFFFKANILPRYVYHN